MIQLRWYVRGGWDGPEKVLQYRVFQNTTAYAGIVSQEFMNQTAKMAWSEWMDVPEENDGCC